MRIVTLGAAVAAFLPQLALAQTGTPATGAPAGQTPAAVLPAPAPAPVVNPVATAFREDAATVGKNLMAAAADMPADKYAFKPTPAQMSFADIVVHLSRGNDFLCAKIAGVAVPPRATKVAPTDSKDVLVARLRETFAFCDQALAGVDDSKLGEQMTLFGPKMQTRAAVMTLSTGDWADHYSQMAIYMRLNGQLPPTAKKP